MKKIIILFLALIATLLLISCGSDSNKLLGKWVLIEYEEDGNIEKFDVKDEELMLFFREDGIGVMGERSSVKFMEWTYENESLSIGGDKWKSTVKKLTSSTLILTDGGETLTFTKIKDECAGSKDNRNLETFVNAYEKEFYLRDIDTPYYQMINAKDGVIFYAGGSVIKIYEFASEKALKKEIEKNSMLQNTLFVQSGRFLCETNDAELKGFFIMVPKCKVETKKETEENSAHIVLEETPVPAIIEVDENSRIQEELSYLQKLPKLETLPSDFQEFLQKFTQNREMQISLINIPFRKEGCSTSENGYDCETETVSSKTDLEKEWYFKSYEEFTNEYHIDDNWRFVDAYFSGTDDIIVYWYFSQRWHDLLVFKKINGNWKLVKRIEVGY